MSGRCLSRLGNGKGGQRDLVETSGGQIPGGSCPWKLKPGDGWGKRPHPMQPLLHTFLHDSDFQVLPGNFYPVPTMARNFIGHSCRKKQVDQM